MKQLAIEHNLTAEELFTAVIALTKSNDLQERVEESLCKAHAIGPVEPIDPLIAHLKRKFDALYRDAADGIMHDLDRILSGEFFKAEPAHLIEPLTPEQIRAIQQTIRDRFNYIAAQIDGEYVPDELTLQRWKKLGLIDPTVTAETFQANIPGTARLVMNAFVFGRFEQAVEHGGKGFDNILRLALTLPLTKVDQYAVRVAEKQAAAFITQFGENLIGPATAGMTQANRKIVHDMAVALHKKELKATRLNDFPEVADKYVSTWQEFKSELYHQMDDRARDWSRIAHYELYSSKKTGEALAILEKRGPNQLVYKVPLPSACPQCKHLYLDESGNPKKFPIGEMLSYGENIGRKPFPTKGGVVSATERPDGAETYRAVAGLLHPWCECGGPFVYTGMEDF